MVIDLHLFQLSLSFSLVGFSLASFANTVDIQKRTHGWTLDAPYKSIQTIGLPVGLPRCLCYKHIARDLCIIHGPWSSLTSLTSISYLTTGAILHQTRRDNAKSPVMLSTGKSNQPIQDSPFESETDYTARQFSCGRLPGKLDRLSRLSSTMNRHGNDC